jgi:integrase
MQEPNRVKPADSNPVAPNPLEPDKHCLFEVKQPVKILSPDSSPDVSTNGAPNGNELAAAFANAAAAFARVAELLHGSPIVAPAASSAARTAHSVSAPLGYGVSLFECCNEFLISRAKKGASDKYYNQTKSVLESFCKGRAQIALADVERGHVEKWLNGSDWSVRTQRNNLGTIKTLFKWCERRGWLDKDRATWIELGEVVRAPIEIHKPEEVATVLETARCIDLGVMRLLAIRYFAGVRSAEAKRLREENILLDHGVIEIPAVKSKTKRRRIVRISDNLRAWLALGGVLIPTGDATIRRVIHQSGVAWSHNVTRHTWESYSVAKHENRAKVAKEAGHSTEVQTAHYDAVALPAEAEKFFAIVPAQELREQVKHWGAKAWGGKRAKKLSTEKFRSGDGKDLRAANS